MRGTIYTCVLGLALATTACKKDDKKAEGGDKAAAKGGDKAGGDKAGGDKAKPASGLELEAFKIDGEELTIEAQVPKGWKAQDWSGGKMFSDPDGGIFPSTVIINTDCAGDCSKIAENLKGFVAYQTEMHKSASYDNVEVLSQKELPGGGIEVAFKVARGTEEPMFQYVRKEYGEGWTAAASCQAMAVSKGVAFKDKLAEVCASLKATKK
jgi:hypothetical protein